MSVVKNTLANYCGRFYLTLVGIVILPFYLKYLGPAAFGLMGIYTLLQVWLSVLDFGFIPALSREVSYYRQQKHFAELTQLLRSLEMLFLGAAVVMMLAFLLGNHWIVHHWLKVTELTGLEVQYCLILIGITLSMRWFADLYRAGIIGLEQQVWLNGLSIFIVTLQYLGGYIFLRWVTQKPIPFFTYQLIIAAFEPLLLRRRLYQIFSLSSFQFLRMVISWRLLKRIFPFAFSIFYASLAEIAIGQSDKFILSHVLSLSTYGYFTLVTIVSSGVLQFMAPMSQALLPRLTALVSEGNIQAMLKLYRNATQMMAVVILPLTGIVAVFSTQIIFIWTGDERAAHWAGPVLFWYVLGNGVLSLSAFQYYLQFAYGNLKLHVILCTIFPMIIVPLIFLAAYRYGAHGTALTWFFMQTAAFLIWPFFVHQKYAPGLHHQWILKDILPIFVVVAISLVGIKMLSMGFDHMSRLKGLIVIAGLACMVEVVAVAASSTCRQFLLKAISVRALPL